MHLEISLHGVVNFEGVLWVCGFCGCLSLLPSSSSTIHHLSSIPISFLTVLFLRFYSLYKNIRWHVCCGFLMVTKGGPLFFYLSLALVVFSFPTLWHLIWYKWSPCVIFFFSFWFGFGFGWLFVRSLSFSILCRGLVLAVLSGLVLSRLFRPGGGRRLLQVKRRR
jgi:hypothetical protein